MARCVVLAAALVWLSVVPRSLAAGAAVREGCQAKCGEVDIPFPFGYGPSHCSLPGFKIKCDNTTSEDGAFRPFFRPNVELVNVSLPTGQVWVLNRISSYCLNASSGEMMKPRQWWWNVTGTPFTFSDTANKFTVVGCQALAYIGGRKDNESTYTTGCVATCGGRNDLTEVANGSCSGIGCCQTAIPKGLQHYKVWFNRRLNASSTAPCSYAVLMDSSNFTFSTSYLTPSSEFSTPERKVPVVLDWAVGNENCSDARGKLCVSNNSMCINAPRGQGYICNCSEGYQGNPYLPDGCRDIDECRDATKYGCFGDCINTNGTFNCFCPVGTRGNAHIENGCQNDPFPPKARVAVGMFVGVLVALITFLGTEVVRKKRSNKRQGYFEKNGGKVLSRILRTEGIEFTFFDSGEIKKATSSFSKANITGEGHHGTVYRAENLKVGSGTITAAVKRCKQIDKSKTEEFVQELVILCRVKHPNVVTLHGCCLHFEAPMLVYEFVENGTLNDLLHGKPRQCVTLATRLRIITETAEALTHLHSPPHPTLHGDVKPENILLGKGWVAKVSDFGCSTIEDNVQVVPKGTLAYLDPEFLQDLQITEKTDVYSFGVVLMEVLTRTRPLTKDQKNLTIIFQESMANGTLDKFLDRDIIVEEEGAIAMRVIHQVAELASRCTTVPGGTRPTMRQVAEELRRLSNEVPERLQEMQALKCSKYTIYAATESETTTTGFSTVGNIAALSTELAR